MEIPNKEILNGENEYRKFLTAILSMAIEKNGRFVNFIYEWKKRNKRKGHDDF